MNTTQNIVVPVKGQRREITPEEQAFAQNQIDRVKAKFAKERRQRPKLSQSAKELSKRMQ